MAAPAALDAKECAPRRRPERLRAGGRILPLDRVSASIAFTASTGVSPTAVSSAQHDGVRAVEDSVHDVRRFGARRSSRSDHRSEHLRRDDRPLPAASGDFENAFLDDRNLLERELYAEIAAGDHDAVRSVEDALDARERFWSLELGDDRDLLFASEQLSRKLEIPRRANERDRDEVYVRATQEGEVFPVLLGQRFGAHLPSREIEPFIRK
jgi:hypothetical protein